MSFVPQATPAASCPASTIPAADGELPKGDLEILMFAARRWTRAGDRANAIRDQFGMPEVRFFQELNRVIDDPRALAHDPVLVNQLRRLRGRRTVR